MVSFGHLGQISVSQLETPLTRAPRKGQGRGMTITSTKQLTGRYKPLRQMTDQIASLINCSLMNPYC